MATKTSFLKRLREIFRGYSKLLKMSNVGKFPGVDFIVEHSQV